MSWVFLDIPMGPTPLDTTTPLSVYMIKLCEGSGPFMDLVWGSVQIKVEIVFSVSPNAYRVQCIYKNYPRLLAHD